MRYLLAEISGVYCCESNASLCWSLWRWDFAASWEKHLAVEEIYEMVKLAYPGIGLAAVYRTIQLLLELRLIDRINLDGGFVRFESEMWGGVRQSTAAIIWFAGIVE